MALYSRCTGSALVYFPSGSSARLPGSSAGPCWSNRVSTHQALCGEQSRINRTPYRFDLMTRAQRGWGPTVRDANAEETAVFTQAIQAVAWGKCSASQATPRIRRRMRQLPPNLSWRFSEAMHPVFFRCKKPQPTNFEIYGYFPDDRPLRVPCLRFGRGLEPETSEPSTDDR